MTLKNYRNLLLPVLVFILVVSGCSKDDTNAESSDSENESSSIVLDLSIPEPQDAKYGVAAEALDEKLQELSDGEMSIKIHANNSLGGEREVFELMGNNSVDMAIQTAGSMVNWVDEFAVFDLPFLFDNLEHAHAVMDSEIADELAADFEEQTNVKILGWVENGFLTTSSNNLIETVEDVENLDIRVQENDLQIDTWNAFGASPTPMAWPEVYTALQQGVLEAQSNSLATLQTSQIFEVQSHTVVLEDRYAPSPIAISKVEYDGLSEEQQGFLEEAATYAQEIGRQANQDAIDEARIFVEENGVEVNDLSDEQRQTFIDKTEPVYEKWVPIIGEELVESIQNFEY